MIHILQNHLAVAKFMAKFGHGIYSGYSCLRERRIRYKGSPFHQEWGVGQGRKHFWACGIRITSYDMALSPYVLYIHTSAGDFTARNNQLWRSHLAIIIYKLCESYEDDDWLPWMLHWRSILALYSSSSWYIYSLATCFPQDEEQTRAKRRYIQGKFTCVVLSISASTLNHVSSTSFNTKYLNYLLFHETSDFSFTSKVDHHVMHILTPTMLYVRTQALNVVIITYI